MSLLGSAAPFRKILAHFPQEFSLAFAYGSAVFQQAGASARETEKNMLDFVFVVDDSVMWHMMNLSKNRDHYSFLKYLGPKLISNIQNYGAGIYYNTLVPCNGRVIKYGVISTDVLLEDLLHWKTLYVAGRLQKPVKILTQSENVKLQAALTSNLKSAITAAFLMLPESFSEEDLYLQIAGLSYCGDFRMIIGEDKSKVMNIVKPNLLHFQKLYNNILQDCPQVVYKHQQGKLEIDKSPEGQFAQLMALPRTLQQQITSLMDPPGKNRDVEEILFQVAHDPDCGLVVHQGISGIVRSSSLIQSAKTMLTAGMKKSLTYSMKKMYKMSKGWLRKT
ncbi:Phosphatidate cytidylyltransferase, mitochondrial [Varanus komodoensis]|uniref:Phosphatidate cytidylyltransferase, mitochondrial n=1 Tax=Varanus komodoensis TaxID=61221 RepID=A0A8D2J838_VARKO|nr:phosphatidate cytidylyltransferase, mitochondrial isoform X2 [Varanus komodoensis]KAF7249688.1 Phosphatidate cytidylyltransferase, mitochondrial [Varanus komodoensis]